jgi:hypothetical protein
LSGNLKAVLGDEDVGYRLVALLLILGVPPLAYDVVVEVLDAGIVSRFAGEQQNIQADRFAGCLHGSPKESHLPVQEERR